MSFADELDNWLAQNDQAPGAPAKRTATSLDPIDPELPIPGAMRPGSTNMLSQLEAMTRGGRPFDFPATDPRQGTLNQRLGSFATGANDAFAGALGAPVDLAAGAINLPGRIYDYATQPKAGDLARGGALGEQKPSYRIENPFGGSQTFRNAFEATVGRTEPKDTVDQLLYGTGGGVAGAAAGFGTGLAAKALGAPAYAADFLTGPRTAAGQAGNVAFGAVGGLGSELGQEAAGEDPTARALAALGGSVGLPLAVGVGLHGVQAAREAAGRNYRMYDDAPWYQRLIGPSAQTQTRNEFNAALSVDDRLNALRNYDPTVHYPGGERSLAQATGNIPSIVAAEARTTGALSPGQGTAAEQALAVKADTQSRAAAAELKNIPDPGNQPALVQEEMARRQAATQADYERQVAEQQARQQQAQQTEVGLVTGLGAPNPKIEVLGDTAKKELEAAKQANKARIWGAPAQPAQDGQPARPAVQGMPDPDPGIRLNQTPVIDKAQEIQNNIKRENIQMSPQEQEVFGNVSMWGTSAENGTPFADVNALRSKLMTYSRDARAEGNGEAVARFTQLRQAIDENIDAQLPPDQRAIWRAKQDAAREHAEIYKDNTVGPLLNVRPAGDYEISRTATPGKIIQDNETAQGFLRAGGSPDTLREALITDLHSGGEITPERLAKFQRDREGAIRAVPGLGDELSTVAGAQAATAAAGGEVAAVQQAQGVLGRILKLAPTDVQGVVGSLVQSKTGATDLLKIRQQIAGNPQAEAALASIASKHVGDTFVKSDTGRLDRAGFLDFMATQVPALQAAGVSPESIQRMRNVVENMNLSPPGTRSTVGVTGTGQPSTRPYSWEETKNAAKLISTTGARNAAIGGGAGAVLGSALLLGDLSFAHYFAGAGAAGTAIWKNLQAGGVVNRNQLLAEMFNNPEFGRAMMMQVTPQNERFIEKAVRASLQGQEAQATTGYDREKLRRDLAEQERRRLSPAMGYSFAPPTGR